MLFSNFFFQFFQLAFISYNVQRFGKTEVYHPGLGITFYMFYLFASWIN